MSKEVSCDCRCGKFGHYSNMVTVTAEHRQLSEGQLRTRTGKRFFVLPGCEEPFKRELNAKAVLKQLATLFENKPWWVRFDNCHLVFRAEYLYRRRNQGRKKALKYAYRVAVMFSAPDWLAARLAKRWAPKPPPSSRALVPKVVPAPAHDSF